MLKIFYNLTPFFEDCYRRINVREYAKIVKISPPTASKVLDEYYKEGLLKKEKYKNYILYNASRNKFFVDLSRIYWRNKLKVIIDEISDYSINPIIILFGSISKAEVKKDSDIDIALISKGKKIDLTKNKLGRSVQLFQFSQSIIFLIYLLKHIH